MIKFIGERDGKPLVGIGLSRADCERLLEGKPITVDVAEMDPKLRVELLVFAGENEDHMVAELRRSGILKDQPTHPVPGLGDPLAAPPLLNPVRPIVQPPIDVQIWETEGGKPQE